LGHLCCILTDVPPQPNSHSARVLYHCIFYVRTKHTKLLIVKLEVTNVSSYNQNRDRVGQSQPGPGPAAPGKSPFRCTDRLHSVPSSRSDREPLAGLKADPRSGLAAFSRPPSVLPCGVPSGFPRSHLAAVAWGSVRCQVQPQ